MNFYPFNIGDYRKDASHLSVIEHGVYRQLIDSYYKNEGPLLADDAKLMRTHNIRTNQEKEAYKQIISEFFILDEKCYRHYGCDKVIDKILCKSAKARASAEKRWEREYANAMRTQCEQDANGILPKYTTQIETNTTSKPSVSPCPVEQIITIYQETCTRLPRLRVIPDKTRNAISARWRQDVKFQSIEFWQGFFDYCNENKFLSGQSNPRPGSDRPFRADLNWVVNATNFANIINEKYA